MRTTKITAVSPITMYGESGNVVGIFKPTRIVGRDVFSDYMIKITWSKEEKKP